MFSGTKLGILKHARSMGFKRIELEVDSSVVRQVLLQPGCGRSLGDSLVMRIRRLMELDWEVVIKHSYWKANKCADVLANIGCNLDSHTMFYASCPRECFDVVLADVMRIASPRVISV
jgi:ribonuclease HI